jgi:hypothetical protein
MHHFFDPQASLSPFTVIGYFLFDLMFHSPITPLRPSDKTFGLPSSSSVTLVFLSNPTPHISQRT